MFALYLLTVFPLSESWPNVLPQLWKRVSTQCFLLALFMCVFRDRAQRPCSSWSPCGPSLWFVILFIYSLIISYVDVMHSGHGHHHPHIRTCTRAHTPSLILSPTPLSTGPCKFCVLFFICVLWPTGFDQAFWVGMGTELAIYIWSGVCCFRYSPSQCLASWESRETWFAGGRTLCQSTYIYSFVT